MKAGILTASDKGARGEREDRSAHVIRELLTAVGFQVEDYQVVPDEYSIIKRMLVRMCMDGLDLVVTTGGTGLGPRDVTPDATLSVVEKIVPGIGEAMRAASLAKTPHAVLSRAVAGVRGKTLIVNLPGSPVACRECLEVIVAALPHAVSVLRGEVSECSRLREDKDEESGNKDTC
ncbi:MAG: MogA/MoaB family molybdenum cofactor biosynthesis protein [Bacillota bacterium]